jgi:Flp pilus assembly protein TadD
LEDTRLIGGAARVEVLLCLAEARNARSETSRLEAPARETLALARSIARPTAKARASCLLGDVLEAQGKLAAAQAAFGEALAICRRLAAQDPSNAGWQRELAVACVKLARLETRHERPDLALPRYEEAARLFAGLAAIAPDFAQWAKDRAVVEAELAGCRARLEPFQ